MKSILIVEDDITYGIMLKTWLTKKGFQIYSASSVARAQKVIDAETIDLILSDLRLPDHDGIDILRWLIKRERMIPLIIMTGYADIQSAVQAMKLGACDYVPKPINPDELLKKIEDALKKSESGDAPLASRQKASSDGMAATSPSDFLEGESDSAKQLYNYVRLVAPTTMSVLINGASGTGKEYVAHRIHELSPRRTKPFVAIDCGIKYNIIRKLNEKGCNVTVVPYDATVEEILAFRPDGIFLSNGPGDPTDVEPVIEKVRALRGRLPIFGICMGHQLISLAYGARTFKMKFGHRGGNHPVKCLATGKIEITSQNHSYAVDIESLKSTPLTLTHVNLLDNTAEGVECLADRVFSVQYHPESAPGPQDSTYLFDKFIKMMEEHKNA